MISRPRRLKYSSLSTDAGAVGFPGLREQEHEIDIGGEIQFASAELAHAEHDQRHFGAGRCLAACRTGREDAPAPRPLRRGCSRPQGSTARARFRSHRHGRRCRATRCAAFLVVATRAGSAGRRRSLRRPRRAARTPRLPPARVRMTHDESATQGLADPGSARRRRIHFPRRRAQIPPSSVCGRASYISGNGSWRLARSHHRATPSRKTAGSECTYSRGSLMTAIESHSNRGYLSR